MLSAGVPGPICRHSTEREANAVQDEISLCSITMEYLFFILGVRKGMFEADREYVDAFRSMELCDWLGAWRDLSPKGATDMLQILSSRSFTRSRNPALEIQATTPSLTTYAECISGDTSAARTDNPGSDPKASPRPQFAVSWRLPKAGHEISVQAKAGSKNLPGDPSAAEAQVCGAAAAEGTAATMRPGPQPAPPRHLGFGIMVDGVQHHLSATYAAAPEEDSAAGANSGPPYVVPGQPCNLAADGKTGPGASGRVKRPLLSPHSRARIRQRCAQLFGPRWHVAKVWRAQQDILIRQLGGPLPVWYIRGPGSGGHHQAAAAAGYQPRASPDHGARAQPQLAQQRQLGKRTRETFTEGDVDSAGPALNGDEDDPARLGHQRGRPRPHCVEDGTTSGDGGLWRAGPLAGGAQHPPGMCDDTPPRQLTPGDPGMLSHATQPTEPDPEAAPFGELLYGVQRMGCDLRRRLRGLSDYGGETIVAVADTWQLAWMRVLVKVLDQLRRLLEARSAVSKYGTGRRRAFEALPGPGQPMVNHSQLRAAVQLLIVVAGELPPGKLPRGGMAAEALDAIDYLLCSNPFVDFDGCDPQARAILVDGVLKLARLAVDRGVREPSWRGVRDRVVQTLLGWLVRQSDIIQQLSAPSLVGNAESKLGGLYCPADEMVTLPDEEQLRDRLTVQSGHMELFRILAASLSILAVQLGPSLALRILDPGVVRALLQPLSDTGTGIASTSSITRTSSLSSASPLSPPQLLPREAKTANALALLHAAVLALLPSTPNATCLAQVCDAVLQSGLRIAAEAVLLGECRSSDKPQPLGREVTACRDVVVPLLGTLYALLLSRGSLPDWAAVEGAIHASATDGSSPTSSCPIRRAWEALADRRYRSIVLFLQAQVVRALARMGQLQQLEAAFRCDPPNPAPGHGQRGVVGEQLGVAGTWLRAALDCGSRPMLAALTAELLRCDFSRQLLGCQLPACGPAPEGPAAASGTSLVAASDSSDGGAGRDEAEALASAVALAIVEDVDGRTCAQLAGALVSGLVRERGPTDVWAALCGLDLTWRALRRELPRTAGNGVKGGSVSGTGDTVTSMPGAAVVHGPGPGLLAASGPAAGTLQAHCAMACVALAAVEGSTVDSRSGSTGGGSVIGAAVARRAWTEQQAPARILECVAEVMVDDMAALIRWQAPSVVAAVGTGAEQMPLWADRLRSGSSTGLLCDLAAVLARSTGCAADHAHQGGKHSVLQRCLALLCLMVSELPPGGEVHGHTNELLRDHVASALMDHLRPLPPTGQPDPAANCREGVSSDRNAQVGVRVQDWELRAAQDNLSRMLHRCIAGSLRSYVAEGLKVPVPQSAQARHATNALAWLRSLLCHPAMRQQTLLERLLPPLLNLVVESLVTTRALLLTRAHLRFDMESLAAEASPCPSQPQPQLQSQHQAPLALVRELMLTASAVLEAAAGSGLMASKDVAYGILPGSIRIDASPLLLMEPAPRNQLQAAAGFAAALLLRTCLECFALPLEARHQAALLSCARPPDAEQSVKVRLRLASYFGNPPVLSEAEQPKAVRQACGPDVMKLSSAPAVVDGADGPLKLSEAAIDCIVRLVLPWDDSAYRWVEPVVEAIRQLTVETKGAGLRYTEAQRARVIQLLREQRIRHGRWLQQNRLHSESPPQRVHTIQPAGPQQQQQSEQPPEPGRALGAKPASAPQTLQARRGSTPQIPQPGGLPQSVESCTGGAGRQGPSGARQQQQRQPGPSTRTSQQTAKIARSAANLVVAAGGQGHTTSRTVTAVPIPDPSIRPEAHYVAALAIERSEDHRVRLSGCMPFADLWALLPHATGQESQPDRAARDDTTGLPPVVGEVEEAKLRSLRNKQLVLLCTLRDASVDVTKALIALVVGPPDVLKMILSNLAGRRAIVGLYGAVHLEDLSVNGGDAASTAAATAARWPLRVKLSLGMSASRSTACGLVIEPRTAYVTQLRMALRAHEERATTVLAVTPATLPLAATTATSTGRHKLSCRHSQEPRTAAEAASEPTDSGPAPQRLDGVTEKIIIASGGHLVQRDAVASMPHVLRCPPLQQEQLAAARSTANMQLMHATALRMPSGSVNNDSQVAASAASELGVPTGGMLSQQMSEASQISKKGTAGSVTASYRAVEELKPVDLAWRGILAASCPPAGDTNTSASTEQGCR
ncbi:hypothetical protein VaNZ11_007170 [Volvox africanus]|uniref:Uncharacterized protein n=1 Tax=Volvox africanus TaxID=51714 RepID=A0ABQ5S2A3_9CHLO|nr:hypothetical protein VaNZ11_007170 [Volvox africanus]